MTMTNRANFRALLFQIALWAAVIIVAILGS